MKKSVYQIREFESFFSDECGREAPGYHALPRKTFDQLEAFLLSHSDSDADFTFGMKLSFRRGFGKIITVQNYVGIIMMDDGTVIEILPKIYSATDADPGAVRTKRLLLDMLSTLRNAPYKNFQAAHVDAAQTNLFEIFVRMFLDEIFPLVKRGLRCSYQSVAENVAFFRGKLLVPQQIQANFAHQERSYIQHDTFTPNRSENRIHKAALLCLYRCSRSPKNRADIKTLLQAFSDVDASVNYVQDLAQCHSDRMTRDYDMALQWSRVFLEGKSFTSYSGSHLALVLLFPMEKLFESYIAFLLRRRLAGTSCLLSTQDTSYFLFDSPKPAFQLRPDLVIRRKTDGAVFVADTKWKLLDAQKANFGISQADIYQMVIYQHKYQARNVTLLYPKYDFAPVSKPIAFSSADGLFVQVCFIDVLNAKQGVDDYVKMIL